MAKELTDATFGEEVLQKGKVAMVDFWAVWCGPCRMIAPIVKTMSEDEKYKDVVIGKLDVDHNPKVSFDYGIRSIPTILFFKDGQVVDKQVGVVPKAALEAKLNKLLGTEAKKEEAHALKKEDEHEQKKDIFKFFKSKDKEA